MFFLFQENFGKSVNFDRYKDTDGTNQERTENLKKASVPHRIVGDPTLFDVLFTAEEINNYRDVKKADLKLNALFNKGLRKRKIFKASAKLYPSLAITDEDLYNTKEAIHDAVLNLV